ncbi:hypothetical protein [Paraburkholderia flava]|uniref:hypothetical protein n=1 Tax=Paraburkholderia flava TaxID=2547393 RepID=UPI00105D0BAF|nr:hypothetical protein [Paraburkholderia flava]
MADVLMNVEGAEFQRGLVLYLLPDVLGRRESTRCTVDSALAVQGGHFFVCLSVTGNRSRWLPVYSDNANQDRVEIPSVSRYGHTKWTGGTCFYHAAQIWEADNDVVCAAASNDRSKKGERNWVLGSFPLPQ